MALRFKCFTLGIHKKKKKKHEQDAMREETLWWDPLSPHCLTAGHIQYALKGQVQQLLLNKAWSHQQQVPI